MSQVCLEDDLVADLEALQSLYAAPKSTALNKSMTSLTPLYKTWINTSRFCLLSTVGAGGLDCSPRGDEGAVVDIYDDTTLFLPDWAGNNRVDSLKNIIEDERASLTFFVPHCNNLLRVNGRATVSKSEALIERFTAPAPKTGVKPKTVIVFRIDELFMQCARAIIRSNLWTGEPTPNLPSMGALLQDARAIDDAQAYDDVLPQRIQDTLY